MPSQHHWNVRYRQVGNRGTHETGYTTRRCCSRLGPLWAASGGVRHPRTYHDGRRTRLLREDGQHVQFLSHANVALVLQAISLTTGGRIGKTPRWRSVRICRGGF